MKELPKELTVELLSLVLGEQIIKVQNISHGCLNYTICFDDEQLELDKNIDTLTRLMKEWCSNKTGYYLYTVKTSYDWWAYVTAPDNVSLRLTTVTADSEFEAVLKATHWVATEKGLL